jgi:hypothetical protein
MQKLVTNSLSFTVYNDKLPTEFQLTQIRIFSYKTTGKQLVNQHLLKFNFC